ncbi:uracil phosphoribosyltransferase [Helcobacillus massiliensis]|uniref:Uracil phosphoribosyltransferase n=1 Tax=Helcobacillus massiliensis TaxID=521392 RepID=A0A839R310_9MICO|nr:MULTISPECIES: uracil phosphoribosyltransferase [Helcobacillus]MBB3023676.1 uracil phosphoribosyltransferase [Helcobacillus massiliensis]MCG7428090.1 uracil phosphoribosyltransferase [Helcobacillus sp. ACRRO]MCT1558442.1 uracil phosphoribosyltransferase [Helcobacillus massiliensis]MCT2037010.1 uracil phosphoribosyltransferase [Helcobacillus massiliensis]MCT2332703.1 uracil phosphoribosyltransferase [Helcobacillus massiliensis]
MRVLEIDHPLVAHKLTVLRDKKTPSSVFRQLADELVTLLAYEATRSVAVAPSGINTPVAPTTGMKITDPQPMIVPILRAGLGMLDGLTRLIPTGEVGFLGMVRNDETLEVTTYANRLPEDLTGRQCFVLDPMLATGHTLIAAVEYLLERGAKDVTCVTLVCAPEGLKTLEESIAEDVNLTVVTAAVDDHLNERGYIVPGLGDAGDRLFGVVD